MTDESAFLKAVIDHPFLKEPRLVYADWLDENGHCERAEFVRVQCELAAIPNPPPEPERGLDPDRTLDLLEALQRWRKQWSPRYYELRFRERDLLDDHGEEWNAAFHESFGWPHHHYQLGVKFRRGFVEFITCTPADWLAHADALTTVTPVERVWMTAVPGVTCHQDGRLSLGNRRRYFPAAIKLNDDDSNNHILAATALLTASWPRITFVFGRTDGEYRSPDE